MINSKKNKGAILLISGPSGCGKSTLLRELYKTIDNYYFSISTTTRKPRDGERNGKDYFFITKDEFKKDIKDNQFLEWAEVHGNYYGTSFKAINKALKQGKLVILDIDVQGFENIIKSKKLKKITTTVFITTPNLDELRDRLYKRASDDQEIILQRIKNSKKEIKYIKEYDYIIINDNIKTASKQFNAIAGASLIKSSLFNTKKMIKSW